MEFNDNSKKVRKLLKIGSPIQQLLDSLDDPVFGNLFMISGGSNSGKSIVAAKLLEHFTNKNNMCSYYDLEMAFPHTLKEYHFPKLKKKNFSLYSQRGIPINDLISRLKQDLENNKIKFFFIDYYQLVSDYDKSDSLKKLKDFTKEANVLGIIIVNDSKNRKQIRPESEIAVSMSDIISEHCAYHIKTSKLLTLNGEIDVQVVKNNLSYVCKSFTIDSK